MSSLSRTSATAESEVVLRDARTRKDGPTANDRLEPLGDSPSESELSDWMQSYQAGDASAFERLYSFLGPIVSRYLAWRIFDRSRTDDLLQEVFLQLHRARATYSPPRPVPPWVLGIARNVALMSMRKQHRTPPLVNFEDLDLPIPEELRDHFEEDRVRRALAELPVGKREAILLHHVWGLTFEEVAGVLGISNGAARVRAHRGLAELREALSQSAPSQRGTPTADEPNSRGSKV